MPKEPQLNGRPRRIFIGPGEIAGYYSHLSAGFRKIGQRAEFINIGGADSYNYGGADPLPRLLRWRIRLLQTAQRDGRPLRIFRLLGYSLYFFWLVQAILRYDSFIFSFGNSLLPMNWDLRLLRFLRKTIICNLSHGSEARPPYLDGAWYTKDGIHPGMEAMHRQTEKTRSSVLRCEKNATWIIGAPYSSSPFLTKPFVNMFALGIPFAIESKLGQTNDKEEHHKRDGRCFRILHAPSHPFAKGTPVIKQAVGRLVEEGFELELLELQGVPNAHVRKEIMKCDFVIDQIFSDIPMAGFALEAGANGKPTIVGGEHLDELKKFVPQGMWPPTIICKPNQIEQTIRFLLLNPKEILIRGTEAQNFVREKWSADKVAESYLLLLTNKVPHQWLLSPTRIAFPREAGICKKEAKRNLEAMVSSFGPQSLGVSNEVSHTYHSRMQAY